MTEAPRFSLAGVDVTKLVIERLVTWYLVAAIVYFFISLAGGLLMALQLVHANYSEGIEYLSPGRWRMVHTNAIAYGFLANSFLGILHWVVPRLTLRPVLDVRLSYFIFVAWQIVVVSTAVGIILGHAQGVEWGETPVWIDPLALAGLLLVAVNFMPPILKSKGPMYVTLWYFLAMFVWTFLTYAMGNFLPEYFVAGSGGGALTGLFIHDLVGLFVTPIGWGMMYFFVPILLKRPIFSHALSLVGFWGLAFFYPLTGVHHFFYTPIPMFLQYGAVVSTIAVEIVVTTVIVNFHATLHKAGYHHLKSLPVRWFFTGMALYLITCTQCAIQATLTMQALIHFTDWVVGHAHLVMFGVFGFWIFGVMTYLIPRLLRQDWYSQKLCEWHYWLSTIGLVVMFSVLVLVGIFQGVSWGSLESWDHSINLSIPFWWVRVFAGLMIITGQILFAYNLYKTFQLSRQNPQPTALPGPTPEEKLKESRETGT